MSAAIVLLVLFAACLHAIWNAIVKSGTDTLLDTVLVTTAAAALALVALPMLPQPAGDSRPYLVASLAAQVIYFRLVAAAYHHGDMSETYPIMRGTAPLLVALASGPLVGEALPAWRWTGVASISAGIFTIAWDAARRPGAGTAATGLAVANAVVIATYTLIDGIGVRKSGSPAAYTLWLVFLTGVVLLLATLPRRAALIHYARGRLHLAVVGGAGTLASYGLALWAMTLAPVAGVAALRETSVIFAAAISAFVLHEEVGWLRAAAIALVVLGAVAIRLS